ncbi:hypothetical protein [Neolewinella sp.]
MATTRTHLVIVERTEHRAYLAGWATAATALGYAAARSVAHPALPGMV